MFELRQTDTFIQALADQTQGSAGTGTGTGTDIASRTDRLARGHAGEVKSVGQGVIDLRIDHGPGYGDGGQDSPIPGKRKT